jgi:hypothetical protein
VSYGMAQPRELFDDPALVRLDRELASYVRDASPEVPATLVDRVMASVSEERVARAPLALIQSLAAGSLAGAACSFREVAHAAFGQRVPLLVRVQAMAVMALVSLFLGATVALAALGAVELLRVAQLPVVQPSLGPSPDTPGSSAGASPPIPGQPGVYPGATVTPRSSSAPRAPAQTARPGQPATAPAGATPRQTARPRSTARAGATRAPAPSTIVRPRATATPTANVAPLPLPTATPPPLPSLPPLPTATPRITLPPLPLPSLPIPSLLP